jgi:hypothetical protein
MDLQLLGPVEATVDGRPIPLGATKQRALLAMLALNARQVRAALAARGAAAGERWAAIDRLVSDLAPLVPLTNGRFVYIVSKRAGNVQTHPEGPLLDQMWVK